MQIRKCLGRFPAVGGFQPVYDLEKRRREKRGIKVHSAIRDFVDGDAESNNAA